MGIWNIAEIGDLLLQLDKNKLPFRDYSFSVHDEAPVFLGKGGSAYVFEAYRRNERKSRGKYAIRVVGFQGDSDEEVTAELQKSMFWGEYFNIVSVYGYSEVFAYFDENGSFLRAEKTDNDASDETNDRLKLKFVVMEKVSPVLKFSRESGPETIPEKLASGDEKEVLKLAYDIANAFVVIHDNNIIHRDIKLENIFYNPSQGRYKIGDFGIARMTESGFAGGSEDLAEPSGRSSGGYTRGYAAPEQCINSSSTEYDATVDIYALGIILFVLMNDLKFPDSDRYRINAEKQYSQGYVVPRPAHASEEFYDIISKMCMYSPEDRYQSMEEVLEDINKLMFKPGVSFAKKHKNSFAVVGSATLTVGLILWNLAVPANPIKIPLAILIIMSLATVGGYIFNKPFIKTAYGVLMALFVIINYIMKFKVPFSATLWVILIVACFLHWSLGVSLVAGLGIGRIITLIQGEGAALSGNTIPSALSPAFIMFGLFLFVMYGLSCQKDRQYSPKLLRIMPALYIALVFIFAVFGDSMAAIYQSQIGPLATQGSFVTKEWLESGSILARMVASGVNVWTASVFAILLLLVWNIRMKMLTAKEKIIK